MSDAPGIAIVGAGLIGLATAWALHRDGHRVAVFEREATVGHGTSFANGALLHPSLSRPWNTPGVWRELVAQLGREDAALLLRLRAVPSLARWGVRFLAQSGARAHLCNAALNLALARHSQRTMAALRAHTGMAEVAYHAYFRGSISAFRSADSLAAAQRIAVADGIPHRRLERDALVAAEPALAPVAAALSGGLHFGGDEAGDAPAFCAALAAWLVGQGQRVETGVAVNAIQVERGRVRGLVTARGVEPAQAVVVCAGPWAHTLLHPHHVPWPVAPVKGYSLTLPNRSVDTAVPAPRTPVVDHALHVAITPVGANALRVAGTAEFAGFDLSLNPARIANLKRLLAALYPQVAAASPDAQVRPWAGLRPMTPDGVPRIGPTHIEGLFVNGGHGHLGWTLAAGSADVLAALYAGRAPAVAGLPGTMRA